MRKYRAATTHPRGGSRTERELLKEQLNKWKRHLFGASSEAEGQQQKDMRFNEAESLGVQTAPAAEESDDDKTDVPGRKRAKRGARRWLSRCRARWCATNCRHTSACAPKTVRPCARSAWRQRVDGRHPAAGARDPSRAREVRLPKEPRKPYHLAAVIALIGKLYEAEAQPGDRVDASELGRRRQSDSVPVLVDIEKLLLANVHAVCPRACLDRRCPTCNVMSRTGATAS